MAQHLVTWRVVDIAFLTRVFCHQFVAISTLLVTSDCRQQVCQKLEDKHWIAARRRCDNAGGPQGKPSSEIAALDASLVFNSMLTAFLKLTMPLDHSLDLSLKRLDTHIRP